MKFKFLTVKKHCRVFKFWKDYHAFCCVMFICAFLFFIVFICSRWYAGCKANEFGDSAGFANGLFSALAFAGVIFAIVLQKTELVLQRKELKYTRNEIKAQKQEMETQNKTLRLQRFENTFFQMLNLQEEIVSNLRYTYTENRTEIIMSGAADGQTRTKKQDYIVIGRELFEYLFEKAIHPVRRTEDNRGGMRSTIECFQLEGYMDSNHPSYFDHYFRHLYHIIKFVKNTQLLDSEEERYEYTSIVRAQLSRYELVWLYYNGLSDYGKEKFKPLIEEYALLKNLRHELLVHVDLGENYSSKAFNRREDISNRL